LYSGERSERQLGLDGVSPHPAWDPVQLLWQSHVLGATRAAEVQGASSLWPGDPLYLFYFKAFSDWKWSVPDDDYELLYDAVMEFRPLKKGEVALEIGADLGYWSMMLARWYEGVRVVALEPNPAPYQYFLWSLRANNLTDQIWPINAGLDSAGDGGWVVGCPMLGTEYAAFHGGYCTTVAQDVQPVKPESPDRQEIKTITLSRLIHTFNLTSLGLLLLDCEGCEWDLFRDPLWPALVPRIRRIVGEIHCGDCPPDVESSPIFVGWSGLREVAALPHCKRDPQTWAFLDLAPHTD